MDSQVLFNIAVAIAGFFGGWILNNIHRSIDRLDTDVRVAPVTKGVRRSLVLWVGGPAFR